MNDLNNIALAKNLDENDPLKLFRDRFYFPRMNGKEVLREVKNNPAFSHIPVIIFSTSKSPEDLKQAYLLGASSFIVKPPSFEGLLEITASIRKYWFEIVSVRQVISFS